jgi:regulator of protease activity HflC (stomatin/prohibitin superfamily)
MHSQNEHNTNAHASQNTDSSPLCPPPANTNDNAVEAEAEAEAEAAEGRGQGDATVTKIAHWNPPALLQVSIYVCVCV